MSAEEQLLQEALRLVLERPDLELETDMAMGVTEGWDSFAHIDLMLALEDAAGVEFGPEEIPEITNVPALLQAIAAHRNGG
jgi:acyl carrier protein